MSKGAGGLLTKEEAGASRPHLFPPSCAPVSHSNHTLRFMSFPVSDISQAYRSAPERTEDVWQKVQGTILSRVGQQGAGGSPHPQALTHQPHHLQIQWCLVRNNHSQTCPQEQAFRLQQGLVTSSAEQVNVSLWDTGGIPGACRAQV